MSVEANLAIVGFAAALNNLSKFWPDDARKNSLVSTLGLIGDLILASSSLDEAAVKADSLLQILLVEKRDPTPEEWSALNNAMAYNTAQINAANPVQ